VSSHLFFHDCAAQSWHNAFIKSAASNAHNPGWFNGQWLQDVGRKRRFDKGDKAQTAKTALQPFTLFRITSE